MQATQTAGNFIVLLYTGAGKNTIASYKIFLIKFLPNVLTNDKFYDICRNLLSGCENIAFKSVYRIEQSITARLFVVAFIVETA